jgi:hypothetical protein
MPNVWYWPSMAPAQIQLELPCQSRATTSAPAIENATRNRSSESVKPSEKAM